MLEFVIKQRVGDSEELLQIGQLQVDSNWTFEDAMRVLGIYVARELTPKDKTSADVSIAPPYPPPNAPPHDPPRESQASRSTRTILPPSSYGLLELTSKFVDNFAHRDRSVEGLDASLGNRSKHGDIDIYDKYAVGKKHVMKYKGKTVTGNVVAGLVALRKAGGRIKEAKELKDYLEADARFSTDSNDKKSAYRYVVRALTQLGLVKELPDGTRALTEAGNELAAGFPVLPKPDAVLT